MAFLYFFNLAEIFSPSSDTTLDTSFPVRFFFVIFNNILYIPPPYTPIFYHSNDFSGIFVFPFEI